MPCKQFPGWECEYCGEETDDIACLYGRYWLCPDCRVHHVRLVQATCQEDRAWMKRILRISEEELEHIEETLPVAREE